MTPRRDPGPRHNAIDRRVRALLVLLTFRALLPDAMQYLLAGRDVAATTTDVIVAGRVAAASSSARTLDLLIILLSAVLVLDAMWGRGARHRARFNALLATLLVLWGITTASALLTTALPRLSTLAVGAALSAMIVSGLDRRTATTAMAYLTVAVASTSLLVALALPDVAFVGSTDERAYLFADLRLAGLLPHPNALAQLLAIGLPAVAASVAPRGRAFCVAVVILALLATASRTGTLAAGIVLVGFVFLRRRANAASAVNARGPLLAFALTAAFTLSLIPALGARVAVLDSPGRVVLWNYAAVVWQERPILGHGAAFWSSIAAQSRTFYGFAFHAHNLWLEALVTLGLIGTVVLLILVLTWAQASIKAAATTTVPALTCLVFLINATTEVPIYFVSWDTRLVVLVMVLAIARAPRERAVALSTGSESRAARRA